jgi:hypothetical protein
LRIRARVWRNFQGFHRLPFLEQFLAALYPSGDLLAVRSFWGLSHGISGFGSNPTPILGRAVTGINAGRVTTITKVILTPRQLPW